MTEGEERTHLLLVGPTIPHIDTLLVRLVDYLMVVAPRTRIGIQGMSTTVLQTLIPGEGQFAGRVHVAHQHRRQGLTGLGTDKPALHDGRHLVEPRHGDSIARDVDIDDVLVDREERLEELILSVRQTILATVVPLTVLIVALVKSTEEDDHIGLLGLGHCLCLQLLGRASLIERAPHGHTVVALDGVTDIATGIGTLDIGL